MATTAPTLELAGGALGAMGVKSSSSSSKVSTQLEAFSASSRCCRNTAATSLRPLLAFGMARRKGKTRGSAREGGRSGVLKDV